MHCWLLCAGVLYSLFGRNLDTGEAVPYSDEHWRNVVARLHLNKTQVGMVCKTSGVVCAQFDSAFSSGAGRQLAGGHPVGAGVIATQACSFLGCVRHVHATPWLAGCTLHFIFPEFHIKLHCLASVQTTYILARAELYLSSLCGLMPCALCTLCSLPSFAVNHNTTPCHVHVQVTYILACAELYFSSLCGLMQERKALHEALVQADGALSECTRRLLGADSGLDQLALLDRCGSMLLCAER